MNFLKKLLKPKKTPFCSVVVVAAGSGTRMGGINKIFAQVNGMPVLAYSLLTFEKCDAVNEIVVVARSEEIVPVGELCSKYGISKLTKVICGGQERSDSVMNGVMEVSSKAEYIAVHDGARPLVDAETVKRCISAAQMYSAAAPAVPLKDTVKFTKNGMAVSTPDRNELKAIQTPQVFKSEIIKSALTAAIRDKKAVTDDCMAAELIDVHARLVEGSYENIKITTPEDLLFMEVILRKRSENNSEKQ